MNYLRLKMLQGEPLPLRVRRVYCVARNYADHRIEMGGSARDMPFFFQKPHDALFQSATLVYPRNTSQLGFEAELVAIMQDSKKPFGYALGMDLTKRDIQSAAKRSGKPWESAKAFDFSGLLGPIIPAESFDNLVSESSRIEFSINGVVRQSAKLDQMIWKLPELISELENQDFGVEQGDCIFTGTPAGVGLLSIGDNCRVTLLNGENEHVIPPLSFTVDPKT